MLSSIQVWGLSMLFVGTFTNSLPHPQKSVINFDSTVRYQDCHQLYKAGYTEPGTYTIWAHKKDPINVYCEEGGTLIQRREFGNFSFQQTFKAYEDGFGDMPPARGDFWIGLNFIHFLTSTGGNTQLKFVLQDWNATSVDEITFREFKVHPPSTGYKMTVGPKISGNIVDDFTYHNGFPFSTPDKPDANQCAINQNTGWWFNDCSEVLPNGKYYAGGNYNPSAGWYDGIYWKDWRGYGYSAKFLSMTVSKPGAI